MRIASLALNVFGQMIRTVGFILLIIFFYSNHLVLGLSIAGLVLMVLFMVPTYTSIFLRTKILAWWFFDMIFVSFLGGIFYLAWIPRAIIDKPIVINPSDYKYSIGQKVKVKTQSSYYAMVKDSVGTIESLEKDSKYYVKFEKISLTIKEKDILAS